jgi:hypothetical protein
MIYNKNIFVKYWYDVAKKNGVSFIIPPDHSYYRRSIAKCNSASKRYCIFNTSRQSHGDPLIGRAALLHVALKGQ